MDHPILQRTTFNRIYMVQQKSLSGEQSDRNCRHIYRRCISTNVRTMNDDNDNTEGNGRGQFKAAI